MSSFLQKKLEDYAPVAWTRFNPSNTDIANWARNEATIFHRLTGKEYPWISAWTWLQSYGVSRQVEAQNEPVGKLKQESVPGPVFTPDGEQTEAEQHAARGQLNKILFREHQLWWDAFEAETVEDMEEDSPTAAERFAWHCAKDLEARTGIDQASLVPVVEAWLLQRAGGG